MAIIDNVTEVLHRVRCKLYPNYLPNAGSGYIARASNEASLSVAQVCAALKNRGGFSGNYDDLVDCVRQFFDEAAYQLCDGYAVNTGYYTVYPTISGTFKSASEAYNRRKNPLRFRFRTNALLRRLIQHIEIDIEGLADASGYIDHFRDIEENAVNSVFVPGNQFCVLGHKIKIAGDDPSVGLFFVPLDDPSKAVKAGRIAENNPSKIIGIAPDTGYQQHKIEIRTQYTGSGGVMLKTPRIISGSFVIETAA